MIENMDVVVYEKERRMHDLHDSTLHLSALRRRIQVKLVSHRLAASTPNRH